MNYREPHTFGEAITIGWERGVEFNKAVRERKELISDRLKHLRTERKLSQDRLARDIEVNRITYAGYESGRAEPSAEVLVRLASYYKVSIDYICCMTDNHKGAFAENSTNDAELKSIKDEFEIVSKKLEEYAKKRGE